MSGLIIFINFLLGGFILIDSVLIIYTAIYFKSKQSKLSGNIYSNPEKFRMEIIKMTYITVLTTGNILFAISASTLIINQKLNNLLKLF